MDISVMNFFWHSFRVYQEMISKMYGGMNLLFWHKYWISLMEMWPGSRLAEQCMPTLMEEKRYLEAQLNEIRQYIEQYPNEDPNMVAHRWIERHAASFRRRWAKKHY